MISSDAVDSFDDPEPSTIDPEIAAKYGASPVRIRHRAEIQVGDQWFPIECKCDSTVSELNRLKQRVAKMERRSCDDSADLLCLTKIQKVNDRVDVDRAAIAALKDMIVELHNRLSALEPNE